MKATLVILSMTLFPGILMAQGTKRFPSQAVYLTAFGGKTFTVLSYDQRVMENFALQAGAGLNNVDRQASTAFRIGASYLSGGEHMLEVSCIVDTWTKILNPIAPEDTFLFVFVGYRYQPKEGFMFRAGINATRLDERVVDISEVFYFITGFSVGYSF